MKRFFNLRSLALAAAMVLALVSTLVHPGTVHAAANRPVSDLVVSSTCFSFLDSRNISFQFCPFASYDPNNLDDVFKVQNYTGRFTYFDSSSNNWQPGGYYLYNQTTGVIDVQWDNPVPLSFYPGKHYELVPIGDNHYTTWLEQSNGQYIQVASLFD